MAIGAIYSISTGIIQSTVNPPLSDEAQITALAAQGLGHLIVPDGSTGANAMIDLSNNSIVTIAAPTPIPNIMMQYIAAQINAGNIDSSAFHPSTLESMNTALKIANMSSISSSSIAVLNPASSLSGS